MGKDRPRIGKLGEAQPGASGSRSGAGSRSGRPANGLQGASGSLRGREGAERGPKASYRPSRSFPEPFPESLSREPFGSRSGASGSRSETKEGAAWAPSDLGINFRRNHLTVFHPS